MDGQSITGCKRFLSLAFFFFKYKYMYNYLKTLQKHFHTIQFQTTFMASKEYLTSGEEEDKKLGSAYCLCPSCPQEWHHPHCVAHPSCWIHPKYDPSHVATVQGSFSKRQGLLPSQETLLLLCPDGKGKCILNQHIRMWDNHLNRSSLTQNTAPSIGIFFWSLKPHMEMFKLIWTTHAQGQPQDPSP